jgi:hypothetical protein
MSGNLTRHDENKIRSILNEQFPYYHALSPQGRKKFFRRLIHFIKSKRFYGKEGLKITEEMLILVGASAIQLTFGLQRYVIAHFQVILMFPGTFHFKMLNQDLKGAASARGTLYLSWQAFQHGYKISDDKRNLGLHEMAHALKLNVLAGNRFDVAFASYFDEWEHVSTEEFNKLKDGGASFLRKYGGTNRMEFFAVAVEHFFEAPEEFQKELPDVFNHLCVLLNQNPMNSRGDFELTTSYIKQANLKRRKFPLPEKIKLGYKYHFYHWTYPITFFGFSLGLPICKSLYEQTLISSDVMTVLIVAIVIIAGILQYATLVKSNAWAVQYYPFYLLFGCAPLVCLVLFTLNYSITLPGQYAESHNVKFKRWIPGEVTYVFENSAHEDHQGFRTFKTQNMKMAKGEVVQVKLYFRKGLLGFWVLEGRELIRETKE